MKFFNYDYICLQIVKMANSSSNADPQKIGGRDVRKVYLITYSSANTEVYDREKFSDMIVKCFEAVTTAKISQWACCMEQHKVNGYHFHMCILLDKLQRWLKVKNYVQQKYGIVINFSGHTGYHTAFNYVVKEDSSFITSSNHPETVSPPKTSKATRKKAAKNPSKEKMMKSKRLSNFDVANIIVENKLRSRLDVLVRAKSSFEKGDRRLYEFVLNRGDKKLNDLLDTVWELETAKEKQERASMSRIDILKEQLSVGCTCEGQWLECALQILDKNCIDRSVFANAIVKLLVMGRGKGRNIYITGPANCGKTFILDPLRVVYDSFLSPATCSYAWLGVENKEVIFLNDFRWSPVILPWADMLLLLEGHVVHFAAPKTNYSKDIEFTRDTPVFATAKAPISFIKGSVMDDRETEMMSVRWRIFTFRHQFSLEEQKTVSPCGHCFAKMLLE